MQSFNSLSYKVVTLDTSHAEMSPLNEKTSINAVCHDRASRTRIAFESPCTIQTNVSPRFANTNRFPLTNAISTLPRSMLAQSHGAQHKGEARHRNHRPELSGMQPASRSVSQGRRGQGAGGRGLFSLSPCPNWSP